METVPHPSVAVATPVKLVPVLVDGHSRTTFVGQVIMGGVVSRTVMVWTQLDRFPHWSVAVQVREMILALAQVLVTESLKLMAADPQPSVAVATPVMLVVAVDG